MYSQLMSNHLVFARRPYVRCKNLNCTGNVGMGRKAMILHDWMPFYSDFNSRFGLTYSWRRISFGKFSAANSHRYQGTLVLLPHCSKYPSKCWSLLIVFAWQSTSYLILYLFSAENKKTIACLGSSRHFVNSQRMRFEKMKTNCTQCTHSTAFVQRIKLPGRFPGEQYRMQLGRTFLYTNSACLNPFVLPCADIGLRSFLYIITFSFMFNANGSCRSFSVARCGTLNYLIHKYVKFAIRI